MQQNIMGSAVGVGGALWIWNWLPWGGIIHFICGRKMTANMKGERFQVSIHRWNKSPFISQHGGCFCICHKYLFVRLLERCDEGVSPQWRIFAGSTWQKGPFESKQKKMKALASSEHQSLESDGHVFILFSCSEGWWALLFFKKMLGYLVSGLTRSNNIMVKY